MINGIDVSHWNKDYLVSNEYNEFKDADFCIFKATEGVSYTDYLLDQFVNIYSNVNRDNAIGFYHYARPENNTARLEARHFIEVVGRFRGKAIYALDVEGTALRITGVHKWVYEWCKYVKDVTGVLPLVYCSESACSRVSSKELKALGSGLWCARWSKDAPRKTMIKPWTFWAIWQYSDKPIDRDVFNGDLSQFRKYMTINK